MRPERQDVIVIGASAGGLTPLCAILWSLPPDFPAAVFVVMHIPAWHDSLLPGIISERSRILSVHPKSGQAVEHGRIYVAPANQHLLVCRGDRIELSQGPKENGFRPAIDVLFRSAAYAYGSRVAGVVLSGALDDGATGLLWIKRMGGVAIVQHPADALVRQMPDAALSHVPADYVIPAAEIADVLVNLAQGKWRPSIAPEEGLPL